MDQYSAPASELAQKRKGSAVKGVIIGLLVDIFGSNLSAFLASVIITIVMMARGATPEEVEKLLMNTDVFSNHNIAFMLMGLVISAIAGYVCSVYAVSNVYRATLIMAIISSLIAFSLTEHLFEWYLNLGLAASSVASCLLGAWIYSKRNA